MNSFWENRYQNGGDSGAGSYGEYAEYKADVINNYILELGINSVSDFGCGDGNQINLLGGFSKYCGFDVSPFIINKCREMFINNNNMKFVNTINDLPKSDMCLSLDVIYHIIDENEYEFYLEQLFSKSNKYVLIFSSNHDRNDANVSHIFHRKFTDWVIKNKPEFELIEDVDNFLLTSAKFFLYKKI